MHAWHAGHADEGGGIVASEGESEPSRSPIARGRLGWRVALLLAIAVAAAYANSWSGGFHFDDWHTVEQNPFIRDLRNAPRFFVDPSTTSILAENRDLRPLLLVTFAVNYAVSGNATWSYHAVNLALHLLASLLVFRIVRDHLWLGEAAVPVALGAALIAALHPLDTEPVNYISARSALLTTVFYLAAFDAAARRRIVPSALWLALGVLTKLTAVTLPLVVVAHWWLGRDRERAAGRAARFPAPLLATLTAVAAAGVVYRLCLLPAHVLQSLHQPGVTPWTYFVTEWSAYLYYLRLFLWPDMLVVDRVDYPYARSLLELQAWGSAAVLVSIAALAWRARRRQPALTFAALWYFVTLAVESTFLPLAEPVNEHRPYLAMLGLAAGAALGLWSLSRWLARRWMAPPLWLYSSLVTGVCVALAAATFGRNATWKDDDALWRDATEKAPRNARAWLNAGHAAMVRGNDADARRLLLEAHRIDRCYSYVQMNLSALDAKGGDLESSLRWADDGVRCQPELALAQYYRGAALERLQRIDQAVAAYAQATALDPQYSEAWFAQGRLLERRERWREAAEAFDHTFAANPLHADSAMAAGLVYHRRLGAPATAVERYRDVLRLNPSHYGAHYQLATALLAAGREAEARAAWRDFVPLAEALGDRESLENAPARLRE